MHEAKKIENVYFILTFIYIMLSNNLLKKILNSSGSSPFLG